MSMGSILFCTLLNLLWWTAIHYPGVDRRVRPFSLFGVRLPGGGKTALLCSGRNRLRKELGDGD